MSNEVEVIRGMVVAARTKITVGESAIDVVADEATIKGLDEGHTAIDEQLKVKAHRFVAFHESLGLNVKDLKTIFLAKEMPQDSTELFNSDTPVMNALRITPKDWMCGSNEACGCCYCFRN